MLQSIYTYTLNGSGSEIGPINLDENVDLYYIKGSATAIGSYNISYTGTLLPNTVIKIKYAGNLDITTNSASFNVFGQPLTQVQLQSKLDIDCLYDGTNWKIEIHPSFTSAVVEAANIVSIPASSIPNNSITNSMLQTNIIATDNIINNAVTDAKIASLDGSKIINSTIDASVKLADSSISTQKFANDVVTNAKLAQMTQSSIKIGNASGDPTDLQLGVDEIAIGTGTTVGKTHKSGIISGLYETITFPISFESGELGLSRILLPYRCYFLTAKITATKAFSGTDDASIHVSDGTNNTTIFDLIIPSSTALGTLFTVSNINYEFVPYGGAGQINSTFTATSSKPTPGGKALVTITLQRI